MPTFHKKQATGTEAMYGLNGEVVKALTPVGVIRVGSEYWKAKSIAENISIGEEVEILGVDGLRLTVKRKNKSSG
jgi:membrane-bound ClpP family serine protease